MTEVMHPEPHPGSVRAKLAEFEAAKAAIPAPVPAAVPDMSPVPVTGTPRVAAADDASYATFTLNTSNPYRMAWPQDPQRYQATLVTSSGNVYLCASKEQAQEVAINGSTSAGANIAPNLWTPPMRAKSALWLANSTPGTPATVAVIIERYQHPEP